MKQFYPDFETINAFTLSLDFHRNELECAHCFKYGQFVSHGIIYKQRTINSTEKVGKRILCSNRFGRNGCGRTFQLYVSNEIPSFRYGATHLCVFIGALLAQQSIDDAYYQATEQSESRNAWRWLNKLMAKLSEYRSFLKVRHLYSFNRFHSPSHSLKHLLPTLIRLFSSNNNDFSKYQLSQQKPLL